jgi:hypothetical protein
MGNKPESDCLIGMSIAEAENYIKTTWVFRFDQRITELQFTNTKPDDYCHNRLRVKVKDGVIVKILRVG